MSHPTQHSHIRNVDSPFTELFAILKFYAIGAGRSQVTLGYKTDQIRLLQVHIENAIEVLLHGLQEMGQLVSRTTSDGSCVADVCKLGQLISSIGNLTEALNVLRDDATGTLKERGEL